MVIEREDQLEWFINRYSQVDWTVVPIFTDTKLHPRENQLSLLYVRPHDSETDFLIPFDHIESLNLSIALIDKLDVGNHKYVYDKKELDHFYRFTNVIDVNLLHYMKYGSPISIEHISTIAHQFYHIRYVRQKDINRLIPIFKHLEYCRYLAGELERFVDMGHFNEIYNDQYLDNLGYVESSGVQTTKGCLYSKYNVYTSTGRPSNTFGGVNFSALNKRDDTRKSYISRHGKDGYLIEYDYTANHLYIIADLIGYEFPNMSPHEYLGRMYYGKDELTEEEYNESKSVSFKLLYGGISKEFKKIQFFEKTDMYIKRLWKEYVDNGYIYSPHSRKKIYKKNLKNMNPQKLFNYLLQLIEFEEINPVFDKLQNLLRDKKSKLVLYLYDALLFDFHQEDGKELLFDIKNIMEHGNKVVSVKVGVNYFDMKKIDNYFT